MILPANRAGTGNLAIGLISPCWQAYVKNRKNELSLTNLTLIDEPGGASTVVYGINDSGQMVGRHMGAATPAAFHPRPSGAAN